MTAAERADWERREAIRAARFEAFVRRQLDAQAALEARGREACEMDLQRRSKQLVLEFQI